MIETNHTIEILENSAGVPNTNWAILLNVIYGLRTPNPSLFQKHRANKEYFDGITIMIKNSSNTIHWH